MTRRRPVFGEGIDTTNPYLFVVGCPRSGTTLLMRMLNAHREIAMIPEIAWIPSRYEKRECLTAEGIVTPAFIDMLKNHVWGFGRFTPLPVGIGELEELVSSSRPVPYAEFVTFLFDRYGMARGRKIVGNKTPEYVLSLRTLHKLWPAAKFIHIIRDGRDVCLSLVNWKRMAEKFSQRFPTWSADPVTTAALYWEEFVRAGREAGRSLPASLYHEVRYEPFVTSPAEHCKSICEFLGVVYDEAMLRFNEGRMNPDPSLDAKHAWLPPTPGLREWQKQMPPENLQRFEAAAGSLLDELRYPRSVDDPTLDRLEHAAEVRRIFKETPHPWPWPRGQE